MLSEPKGFSDTRFLRDGHKPKLVWRCTCILRMQCFYEKTRRGNLNLQECGEFSECIMEMMPWNWCQFTDAVYKSCQDTVSCVSLDDSLDQLLNKDSAFPQPFSVVGERHIWVSGEPHATDQIFTQTKFLIRRFLSLPVWIANAKNLMSGKWNNTRFSARHEHRW